MILLLYMAAAVLFILVGYCFKVYFTGPRLVAAELLFCILFNGFFVNVHFGVALHEHLMFVGDVSELTKKYPLVLFFAMISVLVQASLLPDHA